MHLSAFGVESNDFPSIDCFIDFTADSCTCNKSYYNPAFKPSTYKLSSAEIKTIYGLLQRSELDKLETHYRVPMTDQPTRTTSIYTTRKKYIIEDYGLSAPSPLPDLYKIVFRF